MKQVRVAQLKARLSEYLRAVRRGETIAVLDRETPIAQIVPVREGSALRVRKPPPGTPPWAFLAAVIASRRDRDLARLHREDALRRRLTSGA